jgi:Tfp pilus assembly protein PilF
VSAKPKHLVPALLFSLAVGCAGSQPKPAESPPVEVEAAAPARETPQASAEVREGEQLLQQGDGEGAKAKFEAALAKNPKDPRALLGLGLAEEALGHVDAAVDAYREALEVDGSLAEAHNNLGLILRDKDQLDAAVAELEAAVKADPRLASAQANLALAYEDQGRAPEATKAYEAAIGLSDDAMLHANFGLFLLGAGNSERAVSELRKALDGAKGDRAVLLAVGNGMRRAGKPDEAVRALSEAVKGGDGKPTPALLSELALAQHAANLDADAKKSLEQALELDPKYASAHYVLGSLLAGEGNKKEAIKHYQKCIDLDPKGPLADKAREKLAAAKKLK